MVSVMAIGSRVFGSCVEEIDVSVGLRMGKLVMPRIELSEIYSGRQSGSRLVVQCRKGATYWMVFLILWASLMF